MIKYVAIQSNLLNSSNEYKGLSRSGFTLNKSMLKNSGTVCVGGGEGKYMYSVWSENTCRYVQK